MKSRFKESELIALKEITGVPEELRLLQRFNVEMRVFKVDDDGVMKYVICGGMESLYWFEIDKLIKCEIDMLENRCLATFNMTDKLPFTISNVTYCPKHLEKILKWKDVKTLSNADVVAFGLGTEHSVPRKIDLEDKIAYLHEREPSTNSLSLSKQFELKHMNVQQYVFKGIEYYPSVLTHIDVDLYAYTVGSNKNTTHSTYLTLGEVAYQHFLENMGTPKSYEMRVLRFEKKREYYDGFMMLRDNLHALGYEEREVRNMLAIRSKHTKNLMDTLYKFGKSYSESTNTVAMFRIVFNIINHRSGIHALTRDPSINRNTLRAGIQVSLSEDELVLGKFFREPPVQYDPLGVQVLSRVCYALEIETTDAVKMLSDYECEHLVGAL